MIFLYITLGILYYIYSRVFLFKSLKEIEDLSSFVIVIFPVLGEIFLIVQIFTFGPKHLDWIIPKLCVLGKHDYEYNSPSVGVITGVKAVCVKCGKLLLTEEERERRDPKILKEQSKKRKRVAYLNESTDNYVTKMEEYDKLMNELDSELETYLREK